MSPAETGIAWAFIFVLVTFGLAILTGVLTYGSEAYTNIHKQRAISDENERIKRHLKLMENERETMRANELLTQQGVSLMEQALHDAQAQVKALEGRIRAMKKGRR